MFLFPTNATREGALELAARVIAVKLSSVADSVEAMAATSLDTRPASLLKVLWLYYPQQIPPII